MQNYSVERKEAIFKKMLPPLSMSVSELMRMEGVPRGTLYSWKTAVIKKEQPVPENEQKNRLNLNAIAKFSFPAVAADSIFRPDREGAMGCNCPDERSVMT